LSTVKLVKNSGVELGFSAAGGASVMNPFVFRWSIGVGPVFANPCRSVRLRLEPPVKSKT